MTVVELLDQLIPGCDPDLVRPLGKRIAGRYEDVQLGTRVGEVKAQKNGLKVELSSGAGARMFDQVLVAVGRVPNGHAIDAAAAGVDVDERGFIPVDRRMRTNVPGIYAIGDIVGGPMLAHKASHEGEGRRRGDRRRCRCEFDPRAIPSVAYTDPEVAWMGLTETEARARGIEYEKAVFPWAASGPRAGARPRRRADEAAVRARDAAGARRRDRRRRRRRADRRDRARARDGRRRGGHRADRSTPTRRCPRRSMFAAEMAEGTITDLMPPRQRAAR